MIVRQDATGYTNVGEIRILFTSTADSVTVSGLTVHACSVPGTVALIPAPAAARNLSVCIVSPRRFSNASRRAYPMTAIEIKFKHIFNR